jgi:iron complex outermembrane receptor protein
VLLYGSYSRGFKSGGFNAFSITPTSDAPFDPEYVDNFEFGVKSTLLDGRARFNLALFSMNYRDLQVNQLLLISGVPRYETSNAAKARSRGLEAEFAYKFAPGVELAANYSMLDAKFVDYQNATVAGDDYTGNRLPGAPRHSGSVSLQYDKSIGGDWNLFARAELVARSRIFFAVDNSYSQNAVGLLNGRIGLHTPDGPWGIYLWGRNLTNRTYATDRYASPILPGQVGHVLANPRMYGVEVKLSF